MLSKNYLKYIFIAPLTLILLTACGPSESEKIRIAEQACAIIMETRKFESSKRIQILNNAREEVGDYDYPYPASDDTLWFNLSYGGRQACIDNIVRPPPPPPKTKAQIEAEIAADEARTGNGRMLIEFLDKEELALTEAKRMREQKTTYLAENTTSTYLYCPSLEEKIIRAKIRPAVKDYELQADGQLVQYIVEPEKILEPEKNLGPYKIALVKIKKVLGDKGKLEEYGIENEFLTSTAYFDIAMFEDVKDSCYNGAFTEYVGGESFCLGEEETTTPEQDIYNADVYYNAVESTAFGNPTLEWGLDFILDRKTLLASTSRTYLGMKIAKDNQYQCSVTTRDAYEKKIKEVADRVKVVADKLRATLEEKASEEVQI